MGRMKEERGDRKKDFRESRSDRKDKRHSRDRRDRRGHGNRRSDFDRPIDLDRSWSWHNWEREGERSRKKERRPSPDSRKPEGPPPVHKERDHTPSNRKHERSPNREKAQSPHSRKQDKPPRHETPKSHSKTGPFVVSRVDGTTYEIERKSLKHTQALPSLAYSYSSTKVPAATPTPPVPQTVTTEYSGTRTPETLLESLKSKKETAEGPSTPSIDASIILEKKERVLESVLISEKKERVLEADHPSEKKERPLESVLILEKKERVLEAVLKKEKPAITIKLISAPEPKDSSLDSESIFDIFGTGEVPPIAKNTEVKLEKDNSSVKHKDDVEMPLNSSLRQISMLYDDEDEEEDAFMPTNALRIGSNQIRMPLVKKTFKEKKVDVKIEPPETPTTVSPTKPIVDGPVTPVEVKKEEMKVPDRPVTPPAKVKEEKVEQSTLPSVMQSLDILRDLDHQTTEVDDFLQQIQMQRQRIEEKITPRKPPKFFIDIDSFQQEINEKLKQMPDFISEDPNLKDKTGSSSSSSNQLSSDEEESSDSSASSSAESTTSSSSSSSETSTTDEEDSEQEEKKDTTEEVSTTRQAFTPFSLDLSSLARSPVMLKIPSKPKVTPLKALVGGDEEEHESKQVLPVQEPKKPPEPSKEKSRSDRREESKRRKESDRRDSKRESKSSRSYNRDPETKRSSRTSRPSRRHSSRERKESSHQKEKDRKSSSRSSRKESHRIKSGERESRRRSRGSAHSPSISRQRPIDRLASRSRSRSLSEERRKRSPWRPPIDFWENLNTNVAYNVDEQYFSRAYYDESYNYFDQNHHQNHYNGPNYDDPLAAWNVPLSDMANGGGGGGMGEGRPTSPMRGSLDDRINSVLNGMPYSGQGGPPPGAQQMQPDGSYPQCYGNDMYNNDYHHRPDQQVQQSYDNQPYINHGNHNMGNQQQQMGNQGGQMGNRPSYRQNANLRSISCNAFALQKGNVIELVPKETDNNLPSSGYQSEDVVSGGSPKSGGVNGASGSGGGKYKQGSSEERKSVREKKRLDKKMRKMKLEMELQELLEGRPTTIDIHIEGERRQSPTKEEVRKVIFSDGVLPGDGTSDSIIDSSDDLLTNIDITELSANQLKKYRKKRRKKKTALKASLISPDIPPVKPVSEDLSTNGEAADAIAQDDGSALPVLPPAPPPNEPPLHLQQPKLKREVMERPKKLLYFNTLHRERRMDFFSIFVPPAMFIRLNDPRLLRGHPVIVNRRRIPQPIYPPNVYPPPPQPFQHLPPVQISTCPQMAPQVL